MTRDSKLWTVTPCKNEGRMNKNDRHKVEIVSIVARYKFVVTLSEDSERDFQFGVHSSNLPASGREVIGSLV